MTNKLVLCTHSLSHKYIHTLSYGFSALGNFYLTFSNFYKLMKTFLRSFCGFWVSFWLCLWLVGHYYKITPQEDRDGYPEDPCYVILSSCLPTFGILKWCENFFRITFILLTYHVTCLQVYRLLPCHWQGCSGTMAWKQRVSVWAGCRWAPTEWETANRCLKKQYTYKQCNMWGYMHTKHVKHCMTCLQKVLWIELRSRQSQLK